METEIVKPFIDATVNTLKIQAEVEAKHGKVFLKDPENGITGDVSGVIGVISDQFNGSVIISFPEKTFLKVMSNMPGEEITELNKEIIDGAGELTNIIFGQAKAVLNENNYGVQMALPSVICGKNHTLNHSPKDTVIVVPFESNVGNFFIEICIQK